MTRDKGWCGERGCDMCLSSVPAITHPRTAPTPSRDAEEGRCVRRARLTRDDFRESSWAAMSDCVGPQTHPQHQRNMMDIGAEIKNDNFKWQSAYT